MIFLDHSATTPPDRQVLDLMGELAGRAFGNPSSVHGAGREARGELERVRGELAGLLGARAEDLIFTASGSEANCLLVRGLVARQAGHCHIVISAIEHDSALNVARYLASRRETVSLTEVLPRGDGRIDPAAVAGAMRPETRLVCLMHANNETGAIQPVHEVARIVRGAGVHLHVDAVQSFGRLEGVDLGSLGCDSMSIAGHKFYGPKGVGALALRVGVKLDPLIFGGAQEHGLRAGTENVPAAGGMALAAKLARESLVRDREHLMNLERVFLSGLREAGVPLEINGVTDDKLPGVLNVSLHGCHQDDLVVGMDLLGFAISAGSACSSGVIEPSHVLRAMGLAPWRVEGAIRVSFGRHNSLTDAQSAASALAGLYQRLMSEIPGKEAL